MKNQLQLLMKSFAALMLAMLLVVPVFSQILKEGTLPSIKYNIAESKGVVDVPVNINWEQIHKEDAIDAEHKLPMRGGLSVEVGKSINDFGEWMRLPDGRMLWRVTLRAEGARSLGVVFHNFELPEGAELWTYNENKAMINGALGMHNNHESKFLSTRVLYGNTITIEYIETPASGNNSFNNSSSPGSTLRDLNAAESFDLKGIEIKEPRPYKSNVDLIVSELIYIYQDNYSVFDLGKPNNGGSAACQIDIKCSPVGDPHTDTRRGIAHTLNKVGTGWYYCSGNLLNNTLENWTPYFYTAFHCGDGATAADRNQWQFYFNYERSACGSGTYYTADVMTGCVLRAVDPITGGADLLLVELNNSVPAAYNPYFNGWYREDIASPSGASLHHPAGDAKKISTYSAALQSATPTISGQTFATNASWRVVWSSNANGWGVTEGGSSGSSIFNNNLLVVGNLSGGSSTCASPSSADFYGKLAYQWDTKPNADQKLRPWLDPAGTNPTSHRGWDPTWSTNPPVANFTATPTSAPAGSEIQFTCTSTNGPTEWEWNFGTAAFPQTSTARNPKVAWVTPGTYTISLTVKNAYGQNTNTKNNYITITTAPAPPATNPVTIGTGTTTHLYPLGYDGRNPQGGSRYVRSAAIYTAAQIGGGGLISRLEYGTTTAQTSPRTVTIYLKHTTATSFTAASTYSSELSGATKVYEGSLIPSTAGWQVFNLTSNFIYNGSNNLMVIVLTDGSAAVNSIVNCLYSTGGTNTHQQWAGNADPTGTGTRNANLPNIRMTFAPSNAPVANFGSAESLFFEGFEGASFPPAGWLINNVDGGGNTWISSAAQNKTDGGSKSAAHLYHATQTENGYLITPQITLPTGTINLNFWSFNGYPTWYGKNSVLISTTNTNIASFTEIWSPASIAESWVNTNINLSAYAGQNVYIAFRYQGADAHDWWLDDVAVQVINSNPVTVYEGDPVTIFDLSTNNPMYWDWTTNGALVSKHTSKDVGLQYNVAGQYPVSLRVGNPGGTNTKTVNNYVTVVGRAPIANFNAKGNLKNEFYQAFSPVGGSVAYTDLSTRVPTSWSWTLTGGTPASPTTQNPTATYAAAGEYNVALTATNAHGNNSKSVAKQVKIGGGNFATNDFPEDWPTWYNMAQGNLPGHCAAADGTKYFTDYAEFYSNSATGQITHLRVGVAIANGAGKNVVFKVWDGSTGIPGTVLAQKTLEIPTLTAGQYNVIQLDAPVTVTGNFFVGYTIVYDGTHNYTTHQFCSFLALDRGSNGGPSTAWGNIAAFGGWASMSDWMGMSTSLYVWPMFTYGTAPTYYNLTFAKNPTNGGVTTANTVASAGQIIEVGAAAYNGWAFVDWRDGGTLVSTERIFNYTMPAANKTLTANFVKVCATPRPYYQYFTGLTALPTDWTTSGTPAWTVGTAAANGLSLGAPYAFATITGTAANVSHMVSECFDFAGYAEISIGMRHRLFMAAVGNASGTLAYSINGGAWTNIATFTAIEENLTYASPAIPALAGQNNVRFRWTFTNNAVGTNTQRQWCIDNIVVAGTISGALLGDVNGDGFINVLDIVWMVSHLNGSTPVGFIMEAADVNADTFVNIADLTALINLILGGAMGELEDVTSEPGYIYLEEGGNVRFESDGTLLALQFELKSAEISAMEIELLLDTDHKLAFNSEKGLGIIYSMTNTIIPEGEVNLLKIKGVDLSKVSWGLVQASNVNHKVVEVYTYSAYDATNINQIVSVNSDFSVFPNPNKGNFSIKMNLNEAAYLQMDLIDERGRVVSNTTRTLFSAGEHLIQYNNVHTLNNGIYIIRISGFDSNGRPIGVKHEEKIMIVK
jgi:PKD repeat protein